MSNKQPWQVNSAIFGQEQLGGKSGLHKSSTLGNNSQNPPKIPPDCKFFGSLYASASGQVNGFSISYLPIILPLLDSKGT